MCPPIRTVCHSHLVSFSSNPPVEPYIALHAAARHPRIGGRSPHMVASTLPVYGDMQATTPFDPRVTYLTLPHPTSHYGNPSPWPHSHGREAESKRYEDLAAPPYLSMPTAMINAEWQGGTFGPHTNGKVPAGVDAMDTRTGWVRPT